ncbi:MAG: TetR/AcrR family transcriptional regulator [Acidimicrobiales bacterium]|jgi:AcrR family transcriptional regulator
MPTARTARDRVRTEIRNEILHTAKARLAKDGPIALSLRSVARDLEIAPSALYRYFDGRDALLTALIQTAYESLADTAESAASACSSNPSFSDRWPMVPRAIRNWAIGNPNEWGLIFGSPVPGYMAPETTVAPYVRVATALTRPVVDAYSTGALRVLNDTATTTHTDVDETALAAALAPVTEGLLPGMPLATVAATVRAWSTLIGIISLELFGHWRNTVLDPELFFENTIGDIALSLGFSLT